MNIVPPSTYQQAQQQTPQTVRRRIIWPWITLAALLALGTYNYARPLPSATATISVRGLQASSEPKMPWMQSGQSAIAAPGYGILATHGEQTPLATASITKVILSLCILDKQPLDLGKTGPTYTVSDQDVTIYDNYVAQNGSVAAVAKGEKLTEYQALEALMLPSANNIADSLVRWVFGSQGAYSAYATNYLLNHQINETTIGTDASGYSPTTKSTASDLAKIGLLALKSPVLMQVSNQKTTTLPVAGVVTNYNAVLGKNGITGLKTGNNDEDLGAFLFTADAKVGDKVVPITGAVMGAPDLQTALDSATQLSAAMESGFSETTVADAGRQVGTLRTAWGVSRPIITEKKLDVVHWQDTAISETHQVRTDVRAGIIGTMQVSAPNSKTSTNIRLKSAVTGPSFWWRLTRH